MLSTKLTLIALAVAAGLTAAIPTSADYLSVPDNEFVEASPADVTKPAELGQLLGAKHAAATDTPNEPPNYSMRDKIMRARALIDKAFPKDQDSKPLRGACEDACVAAEVTCEVGDNQIFSMLGRGLSRISRAPDLAISSS